MRLRFTDTREGKEIVVSFLDAGTLASSSEKINEDIQFFETSKYLLEILLEDSERANVASVSVVLNEDKEIACWHKEDGYCTSFPEKCYFFGQVDLIQFSANIYYENDDYEHRFTEYYLCAFKESEDFHNIKNIITNVLEFDDEHIVAHMFSFTTNQVSSNASLLRGTFLSKSYKTLRTIIKIATEICACYKIHLPYFQRKAHHRVISDRAIVPIERVRQVSATSVYKLSQTPEAIARNCNAKTRSPLPNHCFPLFLESHIENRSYDIYENRVCCAFITKVLSLIQKIDYEFSEPRKNAETFLRKYTHIDEIKAPILVLKHQLIKFQVPLCDQIRSLRSELFNLKNQYDKILKCQYTELSSLPKATKVFLNNPIYHSFFKLILIWYKDGEFELAGEDRIFKAKRANELFEIYCLQQILSKFKSHGFTINESQVYQYPTLKAYPNSKKNHLVANTYKLSKEGVKVTLYYEPRLYNYLPCGVYGNYMPNDLELYRIDYARKNNYWEPDFVIKFEDNGKSYYAILDAKYAFSRNINPRAVKDSRYYLEGHLPAIIEKYSTYTSAFNHAKICMVWTLQGRVDKQCKFTRFGSVYDISPNFMPTISYGNCPVNTDEKKNSIRELWNEICSMIPCMNDFSESEDIVLSESYSVHHEELRLDKNISTRDDTNRCVSHSCKEEKVKYSAEEKRFLQKQLWTECALYAKSKDLIRNRFRALPPATFSNSYTLYSYRKSLGAKICVLADCDAHLAIVNYSLPSIHREPQKEVYKKLVKDKESILSELKKIDSHNFPRSVICSETNNTFNISINVDCDYTCLSSSASAAIIDAAFFLKGCIDKYV